ARSWHQEDHSFVSYLYSDDLPAPSATKTFADHLADVRKWAADRSERIRRSLSRVDPDAGAGLLLEGFADGVTGRYRADYLTLTSDVPEFALWADAVDIATRHQALEWMSSVGKPAEARSPRDRPHEVLTTLNQTWLDELAVEDSQLPSLSRIYVRPQFRTTEAGPLARLADDGWWSSEVPLQTDAELFFGAHVTSALATSLPLLVVGGAGSGKSTLARAVVATPPANNIAVVYVPLWSANLNSPIADQVEQALRWLSGGEVEWADLANHMCVVVLDGLDELLRVTPERDYLSEIVWFQQREASLDRPVGVVVTARTSSVDGLQLPAGAPVLKLEDFDDAQISAWTELWNQANAGSGRRALAPETALAHRELAHQPRLLSQLAAYLTDPDVPQSSALLSTAALRSHLVREAGLDEVIYRVSSLGMFNRGRSWISEAELRADLVALGRPVQTAPSTSLRHDPLVAYQVASFLLEAIDDVGELGTFGDAPDALLYAMLSHRLLTSDPTILARAAELAQEMPVVQRWRATNVLDFLIRFTQDTPHDDSRYADYRPSSPTRARANATYSANLVLLRLHLQQEDGPVEPGRAVIDLWHAELDTDDLRAMESVIVIDGETITRRQARREQPGAESAQTSAEVVRRALISGKGPIGRITWSPDGNFLSTDFDGHTTYWEIFDNAPPQPLRSPPIATDVAWHPARPIAAMVKAVLPPPPRTSDLHSRQVSFFGFDGEAFRNLQSVRPGTRIGWAPDGTALVLVDPKMVRIIAFPAGKVLRTHEFTGRHSRIGNYGARPLWTPDGKHVLVTDYKAVRLLRASDLSQVWVATPGGSAVECFVQDETRARSQR
ncbi:MAG TPA: hypothetical protein VF821_09950, partial [Lentzea sp.]